MACQTRPCPKRETETMQSLLPLTTVPGVPPSSSAVADKGTATPAPGPAAPAPSANVTLTDAQSALLNQTYTPSGTMPPSAPVWEQNPGDAISARMADHYGSTSLADRFHGLGTAALQRLLVGDDYSQSVMLRSPESGTDGSTSSVDQIRQTQLHTVANNQVTLDIKTAGGATVHLSLTSQAGGLGVQIEVTGGTLSDAGSARPWPD